MHWRAYARKRALKKTSRVRPKSREIVNKFKNEFPAKALSRALGISLSRVYYLIANGEKKVKRVRKLKNEAEITAKIKEISKQHSYFGYRKVYAILRFKEGVEVHRNKVYRIMKEHQLCLPPTRSQKKFFKGVPIALNVEAKQSNALWGIDMTYIWCGIDAWCYLHAVIDHYDKVCLGYNFSRSCKAVGGVMALADAAAQRPVDDLELRSDNGCHYGAQIFKDEIRRLGIRQTRTMVNTPKGNAVIERFFKSLKQECVWQNGFKNFEEAKEKVEKWITFYNYQRPHQTLNYATPGTFYKNQSVRKIA